MRLCVSAKEHIHDATACGPSAYLSIYYIRAGFQLRVEVRIESPNRIYAELPPSNPALGQLGFGLLAVLSSLSGGRDGGVR